MNKTKIKLIAGLVALFVVGGLLGFLGDRLYMERKLQRITEYTPEQRKAYVLKKYTRELQLTEPQQAEIRTILDERFEQIAQSLQRHTEELETIKHEYDERIKAVLTLEQRQIFDEMKQRIKARWKRENSHE